LCSWLAGEGINFQLKKEPEFVIRTGEIWVGVCIGDELLELGSDMESTGGSGCTGEVELQERGGDKMEYSC
jgi:hypothetical protein